MLNNHYQDTTHNRANANTAGYKRRVGAMAQSVARESSGGVAGKNKSIGDVSDRTSIDFTPGRLVQTGRPLDVALHNKNCFFVIDTTEGPRYTRNGAFRTNNARQLVDSAGRTVSGDGGPLVIPPTVAFDSIQIASDGKISAAGEAIGKLKIVEFDDLSELVQMGRNSFAAKGATAPKNAEDPALSQGFQEGSNVSVVEELVDLIMVSRLYEANLKSISAQDERMKSILQVAMG